MAHTGTFVSPVYVNHRHCWIFSALKKIARYSTLHRKLLPAVVLNTSSRSGSTITKIVLDELDKIASAKVRI